MHVFELWEETSVNSVTERPCKRNGDLKANRQVTTLPIITDLSVVCLRVTPHEVKNLKLAPSPTPVTESRVWSFYDSTYDFSQMNKNIFALLPFSLPALMLFIGVFSF